MLARLLLFILLVPGAALWVHPAAAQSSNTFAVRAEGYVGYARLDPEFGGAANAVQGGGGASVSAVGDLLYGQIDLLGDRWDEEDVNADTFSALVHLGLRDREVGAFGVVAGYERFEIGGLDEDRARVGAEAELFLGAFTLGLLGGASDVDEGGDAQGYLVGSASAYPTDRLRLQVRGGAVGVDDDDPLYVFGGSAEAMVVDLLSLFLRYEGSFLEGPPFLVGDIESHSVVAGATLRFGASEQSLVAYDRGHFKESCLGARVAAFRGC